MSLRSRKNHAFALTAVLLACLIGNANAQVDCTGTVDNLSLNLNTTGTVTLSLSGGPSYTYLCNVEGASGVAGLNGVSGPICKTMYSTLALAKATGKRVTIRFYNYATCAAVPSWGNAGTLGWTQLLLD
jgi:hypothetical protein